MIKELTNEHIGKWFTYIQKGSGKEERGKLKSFDNERKTAWIVYHANENWDADHWKDYTAAATNYSDIKA